MKYMWKSWKLLLSSLSLFYQWFSNIYNLPRNVCFFARAVIIKIGMSVLHFSLNSPFKTISQEVFHNKNVPKNFRKTHRKLYMLASLSDEVEGCRLKTDSGVRLLNFSERLCSSTCAYCCFSYLGISLRRYIFCKVCIEEMRSFLLHFGIHLF